MAFYANFDMESNDKTIEDFIREFIGDCECMAHTPEGLIFYLNNRDSIKVEVKDLKKVIVARHYVEIHFKEDSNKRDLIITYSSIGQIAILPPNIERWSD